ncbi:hypothetical protein [Streptomyces sp. NPDC058677]|uniref:hypothetical protein n=1 Tax=Streptomyces sp. NPDC058677 TaxID=3346594 RepID=UPI003650BB99
MTAPYTRAEAGRDRLDEQIATVAGNVQRLVEEIAVEAAELGRLAAAGAPLSAQARKLTACLEGVARGAARHDALADAVKVVYGTAAAPEEVPAVALPVSEPGEVFRGDRLMRLTRAQLQEKMRTLNNDTTGTEGTDG